MIPKLDPATKRLPFAGSPVASFYPCTLDKLFQRFAFNAVRKHHAARFAAWLEDLDEAGMPGRLLFSGSYLTDKPDPSDIDVLVIFGTDVAQQAKAVLRATHALWTWQDVSVSAPREATFDRLRPYGGFVDAHYALDRPDYREQWDTHWTTEYDENDIPTGVRMGCLEVRR